VSENPAHWARVCLRNMANIAKEATTVRRVLDPLFRLFDSHDYWSPENGIALSVLQEMQKLMDKSGQHGHLLLSFTIKHIDHKVIAKEPAKQISIVKVASNLARHAKLKLPHNMAFRQGPGLKHVLKGIHGGRNTAGVPAGATKEQASKYLAEQAKWEKFFHENTYAPRVDEINWKLYTARLGPEIVNEVKGIYDRAMTNLKEVCTARVLEFENTEIRKAVDQIEADYSAWVEEKKQAELDAKKTEELLVKYKYLIDHQHEITTEDVLRAYPHLLDEVLEDIAHSRWDIQQQLDAEVPAAAANQASH